MYLHVDDYYLQSPHQLCRCSDVMLSFEVEVCGVVSLSMHQAKGRLYKIILSELIEDMSTIPGRAFSSLGNEEAAAATKVITTKLTAQIR